MAYNAIFDELVKEYYLRADQIYNADEIALYWKDLA